MTQKEQIRAEIGRLKALEYPCDNAEQNTGFANGLDRLLAFIDSLPDEQPSKDLEEAATTFATDTLPPIFRGGGAYRGFKAGAQWQKEQMLEDAVEIEVKEDAGGFPIVPLDAIELYDYEKDKPLAKAGDKVKVIIVKKEDEK